MPTNPQDSENLPTIELPIKKEIEDEKEIFFCTGYVNGSDITIYLPKHLTTLNEEDLSNYKALVKYLAKDVNKVEFMPVQNVFSEQECINIVEDFSAKKLKKSCYGVYAVDSQGAWGNYGLINKYQTSELLETCKKEYQGCKLLKLGDAPNLLTCEELLNNYVDKQRICYLVFNTRGRKREYHINYGFNQEMRANLSECRSRRSGCKAKRFSSIKSRNTCLKEAKNYHENYFN